MNWEIFGWCVASFIVLEVIFILMLKSGEHETWGESKMYAFLVTLIFMPLQLVIVSGFEGPMKYINLLWEFLIVLGIALFIFLNWFIADLMGKGGD